jgi:Protein of unknown function (DUF1203)
MTSTTTTSYQIHAIPADVFDCVRDSGGDVSGRPIERLTATGGEPLRCCLRDADPGEQLILFGYEPPIPASPYREIGPVFAHAERCEGPVDVDTYPSAWRGRPQVLRAYDRNGWIHAATRVHDGTDPEAVIADMLAHPDVEQMHSRNVAYGCYMFSVTRSDIAQPRSVPVVPLQKS